MCIKVREQVKQTSFGLNSLDRQGIKKNIWHLMSSKHIRATEETPKSQARKNTQTWLT